MKCVLLNKESCSCSFIKIINVFSINTQQYSPICCFLNKESCVLLEKNLPPIIKEKEEDDIYDKIQLILINELY